jgi:hypothetical protein
MLLAAFAFTVFLNERVESAPSKKWRPLVADRWLYQISEAQPAFDLCVKPFGKADCVTPTVWVLDLFGSDGRTPNVEAVRAVHRRKGHAVCYVSAGSWEDWRPDADTFPTSIRGSKLDGWPGERWLDIRKISILKPLMENRAQACKRAGFDAIDWDNVDGFTQKSGFTISANDQLTYNRMLADLAHAHGMAVGLKNDLSQIRQLEPYFDFAVNEQCAKYRECDLLLPFSESKKVVVQIEYDVDQKAVCPIANRRGWSAMTMGRELSASSWRPCR